MDLLLAQADDVLGRRLKAWLGMKGFRVDWHRDGLDAYAAAQTTHYRAILVAQHLRDIDGLMLVRRLRERSATTPIMFMRSGDGTGAPLRAFDDGADDQISQPLDLDELHARLRAMLRRNRDVGTVALARRNLTIDRDAATVHYHGVPVHLSRTEFELLFALLQNAGKPLSRRRLEETLFSWNDALASNTVSVHIHNLRRKLGARTIITKRGFGYMIE